MDKRFTNRRTGGQESGCTHAESRASSHSTGNIRTESVKSGGSASALLDLPTPTYAHRVLYDTIAEYDEHFFYEYCLRPVETFDGVRVTFKASDFGHAFFTGDRKEKFSRMRAERIDWIRKVLQDGRAEMYPGLHPDGYDFNRRVSLVNDDYVVIIQFVSPDEARFVTAYVATRSRVRKLREAPPWR